MYRVTVFTPTYNRASLLLNAYESLKRQTCKDFEWLIVDDGSIDNTREVVESFKSENILNIIYVYQKNRGQYYAHNTALQYASSELFTFLDSDDTYLDNSIETLLFYYDQIKLDEQFVGVAGLKANKLGQIVGGDVDYDIIDCSIIDFRYKYKYKGDRLEAFKTDVIKKFAFPIFDGKYVPNALVWNRISHSLKVRYFSRVVEYYEWVGDSMSHSIIENRQSTPDAYLLYYSELSSYNIPVYYKIRSAINYWRFAPYSNVLFWKKLQCMSIWKSIIGLPLGSLCWLIDKIRVNR